MDGDKVLNSWKEIAAYLDISVRAAQMWEKERGMPVRRLPGAKGQVFAKLSELEAWRGFELPVVGEVARESAPIGKADGLQFRWAWMALGIGIMGCGLLMATLFWPRRIASVRLEGNMVLAVDEEARTLWSKSFPSLSVAGMGGMDGLLWLGDLGSNGEQEVLFVPHVSSVGPTEVPLICWDARGNELWRHVFRDTIRAGEEDYEAPWVVHRFHVFGDRVAVASRHNALFPSRIAVLDSGGRVQREYWHPGHLNLLTSGKFQGRTLILAAGVNNAEKRATLVALDPDAMDGAAEAKREYQIHGFRRAVEAARFLFPRTSLSEGSPLTIADVMTVGPNGLMVHVRERGELTVAPSVLYQFDQNLKLKGFGFSSFFEMQHRATGRLTLAQERARMKVDEVH